MPVFCSLATSLTIYFIERRANEVEVGEIQSAIDGLEDKLNHYRLVSTDEVSAFRLFSYYCGSLLTKYTKLGRHSSLVNQLKTRYVELTKHN